MRKYARVAIALFGIVFAGFVALQFKRAKPATAPAAPVVRSDPTAIAETARGTTSRYTGSREDVDVRFEHASTYGDGSTKFTGVTIGAADRNRNDRTFKVTANEGRAGTDESIVNLDGDVRLSSSDGMTVRTDHAIYRKSDGSVDATGPAEFSRGRFAGSGVGLRYDKSRDSLNIVSSAVIHVAPDEHGAGSAEISANSATFARRDKYIQLDGNVRIERSRKVIEADAMTARLSDDEQRIQSIEMHNHSRIAASGGGAGSLQALSGADMTLQYAPDGESLQRALIFNEAVVKMNGDPGKPGRQISARTLDISFAPDGSTPTLLAARENVELLFPPEAATAERRITAAALDAKGEENRGISRAIFSGGVQFRERGGEADRAASSTTLDVSMKPGLGEIEEARFAHRVRFEQGAMVAQAAASRYDLAKGTLELTGSEPGLAAPRVVNEQIAVDAARIDVTLDGPVVNAAGKVKSTLQPPKKDAKSEKDRTRLPAMLKQDAPVSVLAEKLAYDGPKGLGTYSGSAVLFQGDTTVKGDTITIDEKNGDLSASGKAMTSTLREQTAKDAKRGTAAPAPEKPTRVPSTGTAHDLKYEDSVRRLTYTGSAHLVGPEGDLSATRIELYMKPDGDDIERAEAYAEGSDKMVLKEQNRTTTGARMSYTAEKETYIVRGLPATVIDECGRETTGTTLTFVRATDTIVVDGNQQVRTQTKGGNGKCQ